MLEESAVAIKEAVVEATSWALTAIPNSRMLEQKFS